MKLSDKIGIQHIILTLAKLGLKDVVLCPGSRNAPLVISFNRHPDFRCISIRDERSAGFFAMGMAIELNRPVAVVCTSGSAALNFAPAISEAYYQRIPLLVITADRLKEWTDQGDGQTINQTNLYDNYIRRHYELRGDADTPSDLWHNNRCLNEGWNIATMTVRGPIHFNIPLSEPLYRTSEVQLVNPRIFTEMAIEKSLSKEALSLLQQEFSTCSKVMILAGQLPKDDALKSEISRMAALENVIVFTESTVNIHNEDFIENIDRCISTLEEDEVEKMMPDLLITIGGAIVSKRIKAILRNHHPKHHWQIDTNHNFIDTFQCLTRTISMQAAVFFRQFNTSLHIPDSEYKDHWVKRKNRLEVLHHEFCKTCSYSDFAVFNQIFNKIPDNVNVHLANSSPIRYAQLFDSSKMADIWCNRGTSGIDGCTSTAMGAALASPEKKFLLITGDVAFNYDINALWHDYTIDNLNIIVINNGGGGIFRIITGPDTIEEMEPFFETSMNTDVRLIAERFQWKYIPAHDSKSLTEALNIFYAKDTKKCILEIFTEPEENPVVLKQYWTYLKNNY